MNNDNVYILALIVFGIFLLFCCGFGFVWFLIHMLVDLIGFETESPKVFSFILTILFSCLTGGLRAKVSG